MTHRHLRRPVYALPLSSGTPDLDSVLLADALDRVDGGDTWAADLSPSDSRDAEWWNAAIFGPGPAWADALMAARNWCVRLLRLEIVDADSGRGAGKGSEASGFPEIASHAPSEILTGHDGRALSFRCLVLTTGTRVTLTTLVQVHSRTGRLYWGVVRHFHGPIARSALSKVPPAECACHQG